MDRVYCLNCINLKGHAENIDCEFKEKCDFSSPEDCTSLEERPYYKDETEKSSLKDFNWDEYFERLSEEMLNSEWINLKRKDEFLLFLKNYLKTNKRVISDCFLYGDFKPNAMELEFEEYCFSFFDLISNYAEKHFISSNNCGTMYGFILNDTYYDIELVNGQGSYISISEVDYPLDKYDYIPFENIKNNTKINIEENIKKIIKTKLINVAEELIIEGVPKSCIKKLLKEILEENIE